MDIFQNQCSESLGFDSMLSSNHLNSPLHDCPGSPNPLTFAPSSPYFASISQQSSVACGSASVHTSGPNDVILPSIFVKIPTQINQQYQQENRLPTNHGASYEIKCEYRAEPIKSEIADTRVKLASAINSDRLPDVIDNFLNDTDAAEPAETPILLCDYCPYATLCETRHNKHIQERHASGVRTLPEKLECPVCENKFYKSSVLELHLSVDHEMIRSEVETLCNRISSLHSSQASRQTDTCVPLTQASSTSAGQAAAATAGQNKSRIYIKNVQLLKKPDVIAQETRQDIAHQGPQLLPPNQASQVSQPSQSIAHENLQNSQLLNGEPAHGQPQELPLTSQANQQHSEPTNVMNGSKIFIRNVSLLQNANFIPSAENILSNGNKYNNAPYMGMDCENNNSVRIDTLNDDYSLVQSSTRGSRIFIKNVDILRNPLIALGESVTTSSASSHVSTFDETVTSRASSCESIICTSTPPASSEQSVTSLPTVSASVTAFSQILSAPSQLTPVDEQSQLSTEITYSSGGTGMDRVLSTMPVSQQLPLTVDQGSSNLLMLFSTPMPDDTSTEGGISYLTGGSQHSTIHGPLMGPADGGVISSATGHPQPAIAASNELQQQQQQQQQPQRPRESKIFIKNISVLKQPTIHLKSVDEVNLMTYDELQLQNVLPGGVSSVTTNETNGEPIDVDKLTKPFDSTIEMELDHPSHNDTIDGYHESDLGYGELSEECDFTDNFNERDDPGGGIGAEPVEVAPGTMNEPAGDTGNTIGNGMLGDLSHCDNFQGGYGNELMLFHPHLESSEKITPESWPLIEPVTSALSQDILEPLELSPVEESAIIPSGVDCERSEKDLLLSVSQVIKLDPPNEMRESCDEEPTESPTEEHGGPLQDTPIEEAAVEQPSLAIVSEPDRPRTRGRPRGAKQTGITKLKKLYTNLTAEEEGYKCDQKDCGARFRHPDRLEYHRKCHIPTESNTANEAGGSLAIRCPECGSLEFRNWNTLHTHLWREHGVDMELYACHLCSFKTPILYRLNNTHMKIHSEERNFKCAICGKAFKNNKQLRNHRRWHREPQQPDAVDPPDEEVPSPTDPAVCSETCMDTEPPAGAAIDHQKTRPTPMAMKCVKCGLRFTGKRQLRAHMDAKHPADGVEHAPEATAGKHRCLLCGMVFKTRYLLQSHSAKHSDEKRFKCEHCEYATNDHNAFRRHKMRHSAKGGHMYKCSYCEYTSIQSTTYRKHLERMHAEVASALLYKCAKCPFVSISELKYQLHRAKHEGADHVPASSTDARVHDQTGNEVRQPEELQRQCESTSSDVMIVNSYEPTADAAPSMDVHSLDGISRHPEEGHTMQIIQHPIIRPAMFANNFSKVDNCYGYQPQPQLLQPQMLKLTDLLPCEVNSVPVAAPVSTAPVMVGTLQDNLHTVTARGVPSQQHECTPLGATPTNIMELQ
ncbi:uncharacterized protein LOC128724833 [Anopheles nili]|uniref:uncharacterized protein LOC128724833 n=1 Tax=Anopheles nili TaxID=185578 RepID=UPI00237B95C3|nr:uncharacterized protein LOC128724833 [Anopheles nili]